MRALRVSARVFVHPTEDEARVRDALLWTLAIEDQPKASQRLTRQRMKGHHGGEILAYDGVLKRGPDLEAFRGRLQAAPATLGRLRREFRERLDEDRVLHFRLDKQACVQGQMELTATGDAVQFEVKYEGHGEVSDDVFPFEARGGRNAKK